MTHTLPPRTSSPMIRHAAVCINPLFCVDAVPAMTDDVIDVNLGFAADECAKLGMGRERCRTTWVSLPNIRVSGSDDGRAAGS
jgi:hypothetical protein